MILRSPQIIDFPKENQGFLRCGPGNGVTGADLHLRRGGFAPPPGRRGHLFRRDPDFRRRSADSWGFCQNPMMQTKKVHDSAEASNH